MTKTIKKKTGRHGNHPRYTKYISELLKKGPEKGESSVDFIRRVTGELFKKINDNPNVKVNDLYNIVLKIFFSPNDSQSTNSQQKQDGDHTKTSRQSTKSNSKNNDKTKPH